MKQRFRAIAVVVVGGCGLICHGQDQPIPSNTAAFSMKAVKGVPFSAKVITETNQSLIDGNRILHTATASIARDSEGRTRREQALPLVTTASATTASVVFIQDPASGAAYMLESQSRLARKWSLPFADTASPPAEVRRIGGKEESTSTRSESLGTEVVEGMVAEGTRITRTLAADEAGNERPLAIVSETWYSTELQTIILNKTTDPRLGETIYRLTEIQRGEPLRSLFEIPAEYVIREEPEPRTVDKARNK